jgi:hypothetical protein
MVGISDGKILGIVDGMEDGLTVGMSVVTIAVG